MIRKIKIGGFKGIGDPIEVPLKPITILFGRNSVGKSSIIQALLYGRDLLNGPEFDMRNPTLAASTVDLGGFDSINHRHNHGIPVYLSIEVDATADRIPEEILKRIREIGEDVNSVSMDLIIRWLPHLKGPGLAAYYYRAGEQVIGRLYFDLNVNPPPLVLEFGKPEFGTKIEIQNDLSAKQLEEDPDFLAVATVHALVNAYLGRIRHVGRFRQVPSRELGQPKGRDSTDWSDGKRIWELIATQPGEKIDAINDILSELLSVRYKLEVGEELSLVSLDTNVRLHPSDVGTGISQLVPVIWAAVATIGGFISVEQPELHLHPKLQSDIADLFMLAAGSLGDSGPRTQFLIETHSELFILRVLRRIRECNEGQLNLQIRPEDVSLIFVDCNADGTTILPIPITPDGDLGIQVPGGFFAERTEELF